MLMEKYHNNSYVVIITGDHRNYNNYYCKQDYQKPTLIRFQILSGFI